MQFFFSATRFIFIIVTIVYIKYVINIWNNNLGGSYVYVHINIQYKIVYI